MIGAVRLAEVAEFIPAVHRGANVPLQFISIDTRTLQPGDLYVAIVGERLDGHDYIDKAIEKGGMRCRDQSSYGIECAHAFGR